MELEREEELGKVTPRMKYSVKAPNTSRCVPLSANFL